MAGIQIAFLNDEKYWTTGQISYSYTTYTDKSQLPWYYKQEGPAPLIDPGPSALRA